MAVVAIVLRGIAAIDVGRSPNRYSHVRSRCCGIGIRPVGVELARGLLEVGLVVLTKQMLFVETHSLVE